MLYEKEKFLKEIEERMNYFKDELKKVVTGKPDANMIGTVDVEAYGTNSKLNTVGQIVVEDAVSVKVNVWDKSILGSVDKALREANLGASVIMEADSIRLRFNAITEEDRKEKTKSVGKLLEDAKVKIRQIRQDFRKKLDALDGVSEDDVKRDEEDIQKETDNAIEKAEEIAAKKEKELMSM
ncbi:MAG: ribosome-recycling factor [Candidatus Dojkabacteria bacterium]|nr:ribosome-recycling factor [Candidatus Dojkabacteria bacterium]